MKPADPAVFARGYVEGLVRVLEALPFDAIGRALAALEAAYGAGRTVFLAGNGGSAATASHMCNDLVWGIARLGRPGFRAVSLSDNVSLLTAVANDSGYERVFLPQLEALASAGDVLVAISGSGNSPNVVRAVERAREMGLTTVGFLGMAGGALAGLVDVAVIVPSDDYGPIEDAHMMLDHLAIAYLRQAIGRP